MRRRERTPNLIGREPALAALGDALGGVADAGSVVLVRGEVGIGKTRLLEEFAARVGDEAHVVRGGCVEGVSYAPWTEVLRRLLSTADVVAADDLPRRVRSEIARLLPHLSLDEADAGGRATNPVVSTCCSKRSSSSSRTSRHARGWSSWSTTCTGSIPRAASCSATSPTISAGCRSCSSSRTAPRTRPPSAT